MEMKLTDDGPVWVANIRRSGASSVLTVPADLADSLDLEVGDTVEIGIDGQTVRIDPNANADDEDPE